MSTTIQTICFIGSGAIASAIAGGLVKQNLFARYLFVDLNKSQLEQVSKTFGGGPAALATKKVHCATYTDAADAIAACNGDPMAIVFSVKPQYAASAAAAVAPRLTRNHLVISVMAGVQMQTLRAMLGPHPRLVRTMPNAALMAEHGCTGFACDASASADDVATVRRLFSAIGFCAQVNEHQLDAVTGLSGSGPAYVALFVESLADGGVRMGIPRDVALQLAVHTVIGSGKLMLSQHPAALKDLVASPGGTTITGIAALEENKFRFAVMEAVKSATNRAQQLSKL